MAKASREAAEASLGLATASREAAEAEIEREKHARSAAQVRRGVVVAESRDYFEGFRRWPSAFNGDGLMVPSDGLVVTVQWYHYTV